MKHYEGYCQYIEPKKCDECQKEAWIEVYVTDTEKRNELSRQILCSECLEKVGRGDIIIQ